jgi:hypothetical protein
MSRPPAAAAPAGRPAHYEIRVRGVLDPHWSGWFEGLQVSSDAPGQTLITGPIVDQAALHGLLAKVRDLGLPLLSVRQLSPGEARPQDPTATPPTGDAPSRPRPQNRR